MLRQVAQGVLIHQSEFCESNAVVVQGQAGVLLIDPGIYGSEMACLANDLSDAGPTVVAGFSTHPHWDHVLWDTRFGSAPRYGTVRCAAATTRDRLSGPCWQDSIAEWVPLVSQVAEVQAHHAECIDRVRWVGCFTYAARTRRARLQVEVARPVGH
jgi:glyoxylase-like metal-dependent hydrolase (beta-lactamase superfamily II)